MAKSQPSRKKIIDWAAIETEFVEGTQSIREIADWHRCSEGAIRKRAKQKGWVREVRESTQAQMRTEPLKAPPVLSVSPDVRQIVRKGQDLVLRLLDELDTATTHQGVLEEMIIEDTSGDRSGQRRTSMLRAVELPSRAQTIKALANATKTLADALKARGEKPGEGEDENAAEPKGPDPDSWEGLLQ